jgi:hypothetical protein
MEPTLLYAPSGDGWWPVLSPSGYLVAFGNTDLRVVDLRSGGTWPIGPGRNLRFLDDVTVTWTRDVDDYHMTRWTGDLRAWDGGRQTYDDPALVAANTFDARDRHWASYLTVEARVVRDDAILATGVRGVSVYGDDTLTVGDGDTTFRVYRQATLARTLALPADANIWKLQARGWIPFGYWGQSRAYDEHGVIHDLTVTPYRGEGLASLVWAGDQLWVWTATERPSDLRRALLGRPLGATDCVVIENEGLANLDAAYTTDLGFIVCGCSDRGQLLVYRVPLDATRTPINVWAGTEPEPPEPPEPEPPPAGDGYNAPAVAIRSYGPQISADSDWRAEIDDGQNPGWSYTVELLHGSFHFSIRNPKGEDRSATARPVQIG